MTAAGKLMVFANLVAALALATWAGSLYANRPDWVDRQSEAGPVKGELTQLKEAVDRANKQVADAVGTYNEKTDEGSGYAAWAGRLLLFERSRAARSRAFAERLRLARTTGFYVQRPRNDADPLIDVQETGDRVKDQAGQDLRGLDDLQSEYEALLRQGEDAARAAGELTRRYEEVSRQIADVEAKVQVQRGVLAALADEQDFLDDLRVNWDEELKALARRQKQLDAALGPAAAPAGDGRAARTE